LAGQEEFNVEIKDYGFADADNYFDTLWNDAAPITEIPFQKQKILDYVGAKTLATKVTPYEAYALILKTYIDLQQTKHIRSSVIELIAKNGFKEFAYQIDAVNQGLSIINEYNGVVIADVVGLGKSVIAALIAKNLDRRTMIICPPGLIGERNADTPTGWYEYVYNFELSAEVESRGKLVDIAKSIDNRNIEVVIVDEAHYFRNQDTEDYEALLKICRDRIVILLTATPFNNSPADIFSLLKLFIVPGKSGITIDHDLEALFAGYGTRFKKLSDIMKFSSSKKAEKKDKARKYYTELFGEQHINLTKVREETKRLANQIKNVISPVIIRRNRLDLRNDYVYSQEVTELSTVKDPVELFYTLTPSQSSFYTDVLTRYFGEEGQFSGAIYQPFAYENDVKDDEKLDEQGNRAFNQQANLFDFMRRLLVKRFESSFGAFNESINRFLSIHIRVKAFIEKTGGKYILDRKLMDTLMEEESMDTIMKILDDYENNVMTKRVPKNNTVYDTTKFKRKQAFFDNIDNDIALFKVIKMHLNELDIVENDPKRDAVSAEIENIIIKNKNRKIIVFSEYVDTVKHLEPYFRSKFGTRMLICDGGMSPTLHKTLNANFNAQYKGEKENLFDILITSDKLSEGFNLNRAGVIINYDIPWNPTRVIQRVGRINRIGAKVFDELYIYNFFPSEAGANVVQIREIAMQKMFLIHNALGEDAKMFDADEEPTPAGLFNKVNENPDNEGEESLATRIRNSYFEITSTHPEVIERISELPARIKSGKPYSENQVCVIRRKGLSLFTHLVNTQAEKLDVKEVTFEELLELVVCEYETPYLPLSPFFWAAYNEVKEYKTANKKGFAPKSLEAKAHENLKCALRILDAKNDAFMSFVKVLITDIEKYKTLSDRTLGRIGRNPLTTKATDEQKKTFTDEVQWIKNSLGADYLDRILKRIEHQKNEVVIAVENQLL
jgi:superfamily II DNA or RNA helicase